jgi:DinB family protein
VSDFWAVGVEVCAECGFDGAAWTDADAVSEIAALPDRWSLAVDGLRLPDLLRRPRPAMWSIAEYVDHVREVLFGMRFLLDTALNSPGSDLGDSPAPRFDPEPAVIDVQQALTGLSGEARLLSDQLETTAQRAWATTVIVDGDELDVHWIARHAVHDPSHHLGDVGRLRGSL